MRNISTEASSLLCKSTALLRSWASVVTVQSLPPDASAGCSLYRLLTQRWSPPPWIMHEIRVQITPINMQYSLRWLNCHLIVMNMWKMSGTHIAHHYFFTLFFFLKPEMSLEILLEILQKSLAVFCFPAPNIIMFY